MLNVLATTFCLLSGLGCTDEEVIGPRGTQPAASIDSLVVADSLCARVEFTITSATAVQTTFPSRTTCTSGLVLIRGPAASWAQNPDRRLRLFVRLLNRSGQALQLPVSLRLPAGATVVLAPPGAPASKVVALNSDFTDGSGVRYWLIGGTGTLRANDSTVLDTLLFNVKSPVTRAAFAFQASANSVGGSVVPSVAPDTVPAWFDHDTSYTDAGAGFLKRVISVAFRQGATQAEKQAAVNLVQGQVIGGIRFASGDGYYEITVADDGSGTQLRAAVAALLQLPYVESASLVYRLSPGYLRPVDDAGWTKPDWSLSPDSATGQNWALQEVNAPLAWGCSVGNSGPNIWVIDHAFDATEVQPNLRPPFPAFGQFPGETLRHGTYVSSILAARGNNSSGITGGMWVGALRLDEAGVASVRFDELAARIANAGSAGAEIVNLSWYYHWKRRPGSVVDSVSVDSALVRSTISAMMVPLRRAKAAGQLPVVITIAGNDSIPAWWAVVPALRDSFPQRFIVVGGSRRHVSPLRPRDRWPASNTGPLVDLYAPGDSVWALMNIANQSAPVSGTSYAAPLVTAIAGLVRSFDPTLPLDSVKPFVIEGARRGGRAIGIDSVFVADAYESLKRAAERLGAPLCGNRLYAIGESLFVQRGSSGDEKILTLTTPGGSIWITSYHGGHDLGLNEFFGFTWANGRWDSVTPPFNPPTSFSGAWNSALQLSHDRDSSASAVQVGITNPMVGVRVTDLTSSQTRTITTISGGFALGGNRGGAVFPPLGRELIVPIQVPNSLVWNVNAVDIVTGATRLLYQATNAFRVHIGISEDGREFTAIAEGSPFECRIEFRSMASGSLLRPAITSPPPTNGCRPAGSSFAPIRGLSSLRR